MRIHLVTGGAGFLGSHLIDRLMEAGEEVIMRLRVFDRFDNEITFSAFDRCVLCGVLVTPFARLWHLN